MSASRPVALCILDGWGLSTETEGNAPALAKTPNFDRLIAQCPNAQLITHGNQVGLPSGQMGNSEVGHTNIGAGRIVAMDLGQIDLAIEDGSFFHNAPLQNFAESVRAKNATAHLLSVVSDGGVHGHISHLLAASQALVDAGLRVVVHAITDGRDVAPRSADRYIQQLQKNLPKAVQIGTVTGRYFALDRDNRWDRVHCAYDAIVHARSKCQAASAAAAVAQSYARDVSDEFIAATVIEGYRGLAEGDGVFCLNFRADRAREILSALGDPDFDSFATGLRPALSGCLGMVNYSERHNSFMTTCYPKKKIANTLGSWVAQHGKRQFRLAETEKYPHVTFFLNGGLETPESGEDRLMPLSPKVATYDLQPEMSSQQVTQAFVAAWDQGYDLIVTNYANPDMVGHTGDLAATIKACEAVDFGLGQVLEAMEKVGGCMIVTADHGNCERMTNPETGEPHTAHTVNPVPVILAGGPPNATLKNGILADLAPSLLALMQVPVPAEMTGKSLIKK